VGKGTWRTVQVADGSVLSTVAGATAGNKEIGVYVIIGEHVIIIAAGNPVSVFGIE
jgi:hypothetical protein